MRTLIASLLLVLAGQGVAGANERVVGQPCEGCEAVFEGLPADPASRARIGTPNEPGEPMRITGTVKDGRGRPARNVVVYAYQTNAKGIYPTSDRNAGRASHRHGLLRGWALTDAGGRYAFDTIRPAGYPGTDLPAHVHMHVIERGRCTYYIDDILFRDDPRLTAQRARQMSPGRGGQGVAQPLRKDGTWQVTRDITLGSNIPGYADCGSP